MLQLLHAHQQLKAGTPWCFEGVVLAYELCEPPLEAETAMAAGVVFL